MEAERESDPAACAVGRRVYEVGVENLEMSAPAEQVTSEWKHTMGAESVMCML